MWPELSYDAWKDTLDTLHMWMQIVGKVKLELAPFLNQWWETAFSVKPTGLTTGRIPYKKDSFEIDFNFLTHTMHIATFSKHIKTIQLYPRPVSEFYADFFRTLKEFGIAVSIYPVPVEFANPIPFKTDTIHASYDKHYVEKWWQIQLQSTLIFDRFRSDFRGKSSPVHFYWGSFDLNSTRFSGNKTKPPLMEGVMRRIMEFAENEENFAFGFWPGDEKFPHAAYYSYIYPAPAGLNEKKFDNKASFNEQLGECVLLYDDVRNVKNPEKNILHFLESTYTISAKLAGWDINELQSQLPGKKYD